MSARSATTDEYEPNSSPHAHDKIALPFTICPNTRLCVGLQSCREPSSSANINADWKRLNGLRTMRTACPQSKHVFIVQSRTKTLHNAPPSRLPPKPTRPGLPPLARPESRDRSASRRSCVHPHVKRRMLSAESASLRDHHTAHRCQDRYEHVAARTAQRERAPIHAAPTVTDTLALHVRAIVSPARAAIRARGHFATAHTSTSHASRCE